MGMDEKKPRINGSVLRELRDARLMTRPELAKETGVGTATIARIERDKAYRPRRSSVMPLLEYFGVSLESVLARDPSGDPPPTKGTDEATGDDSQADPGRRTG